MKKFLILLSVFLVSVNEAKADFSDFTDSFMLETAATLELQFPNIVKNGQNSQFKNNSAWSQIKNFENIAPGLHFRVHKYLGFNLNIARFSAKNQGLNDEVELSQKASLKVQTSNFSSLWYVPLAGDNLLEGFIELGLSDIQSQLKYNSATSGFVTVQDHETAALYGAGIQFAPYDSQTVFRLSVQKYNTKLTPLNTDIVIWRAGVMQYF